MLINVPPPLKVEILTASSWQGQDVTLSASFADILTANSNRVKVLIDNRSSSDCYITFGTNANAMRIMPDNLWIEVDAAKLLIRGKGTGTIFIAQWLK